MPIIQVDYSVPPKIAAGLASGEFQRFGSVIRDSQRITTHLKEVGRTSSKMSASGGLFGGGVKSAGSIVAIGIGVIGVIGGAVYLAKAHKRDASKSLKLELVERYNASLLSYLEAITSGALVEANLTDLRAAVEEISALNREGEIAVELSQEHSEALNTLLGDFTRKLAEANSVSVGQLPEPTPGTTEKLLEDINMYLDAQQKIFDTDSYGEQSLGTIR